MYTNAKYYKAAQSDRTIGIMVEINGTISCVPLDPDNKDYKNLMALVEKGQLIIAPAEAGDV